MSNFQTLLTESSLLASLEFNTHLIYFRNKYLLLNSQELNELSAISLKANIPEVEALVNTDRYASSGSIICSHH